MLSRLTARERIVLWSGGAFLLVFILVRMIVMPAMEERTNLKKLVKAKQDALVEIHELKQEYQRIMALESLQSGAMLIQDADFSLFSFLDSCAEQSGVKDNVAYMKPSAGKSGRPGILLSNVKLKLDDLFLEELVNFLYRLETAPQGVSIKTLSLSQTGKDSKQIEAVLEAQALITGDPS